MSKYYVSCGVAELVLSSDSAESAALALLDRILTPHLWVYDDQLLSERDRLQHLMLEALLHLPTEIRVSEKGFASPDNKFVSVPDTVVTWHELMTGMRRLFAEAGIDRTIRVLAGEKTLRSAPDHPHRPR